MGQQNKLIIQSISKSYSKNLKALDNISLELTNGMFGLLGPNGAGKSSLMRSIATLQPIDEGKLIFNGKDINQSPQSIRPFLGYLPQEFGVYPKCSANKLLHFLAVLKGIHDKKTRQQQIDCLLERTNLSQYRHNSVSDFSGGMRQRFGITQALLGNPKILIVDEPTAGLDPKECYNLHNMLCEIAEQMIIIFSTHIVEDIQNLCSHMAVLDAGKIRFQGSPLDLISLLNDKLWCKTVDNCELQNIQSVHKVLSTRLNAGQHRVHIISEKEPGNNFKRAQADLQDSYFYLLNHHQGSTTNALQH